MKVLFLDVDGVLNSSKSFNKGLDSVDQDMIHQLKRIIVSTGAEIVLTSTWRLYPQLLDKISNILSDNDLTIRDTTSPSFRNRAYEINQWLDKRKYVTQFAILDDEQDAEIEGHFFRTDFSIGLNESIANQVIEFLNGK